MKTILVTGGAGFLGSNLCAKLLKDKDNRVIAMDNLYTGRLSNLAPFQNNPAFEFLKADVRQPIDIPVDEIYNAACPASPPAYQKTPTQTTETCIFGMMNMLKLATKYNAKVLQFSTSEVYGNAQIHPQPESYWGNVNPDGIRSCYDEGKRCAETLCFDYQREFGTRVKVIRIFNTYGPNMDPKDGRVISNFLMQALRGESLTIYGDGTQTRSFCYVDDLIEGIIRVMATPDDFSGPVNMGNPGEFTLLELASLIEKILGHPCAIEYKPLPSDDPVKRRPDITLAKKVLNWEPHIPLEEGLRYTAEYFKTQL